MEELEKRIAERFTRRFGEVIDPIKQMAKLLEEAGELARAIIRDDKKNAIEELGDCVIVLSSVARYLGVDLKSATADKLAEHEKRLQKWEQRNSKS